MEDNFDPDKYLEETPEPIATESSFNPDEYLSEETTLETPTQEVISEQPKIKAAAITGGLATEALRKGISGAGDMGLKKLEY